MRRGVLGTAVSALLIIGGLIFVGSTPAASAAETQTPDTSNFVFESLDAEYELALDDEGRSTLHTTETFVAVFPDFDQNRGFIRDIPRELNGHDTNITVLSVTDEAGNPRPYSTEPYGDFLAVTMAVPKGQFVHGTQTYVIEYTQRDVTNFFEDTGADEFYWDVNGTGWAQPFGQVSARLTLSDELVEAFNGQASCYRGAFGATETCPLTAEGQAITASAHDLGPGENLTVAVGFAPHTFAGPPVPFLERVPLLNYAGIASGLGGIALTIWLAIRGRVNVKTGRAIIAEYEPPKGLAVATAATLLKAQRKAATATLLDLAVRRKIRLLHDEPSGLYGAQLVDDSGLRSPDKGFVKRLFPPETLWFMPKSTRLGDAARALVQTAAAQVAKDGLFERPPTKLTRLIPLLYVAAIGLPVLQAVILQNAVAITMLLALGIIVLVWVGIFSFTFVKTAKRRSLAGSLLHDHLMGLREYIRLAEADRIRMLQSASGAIVSEDRIVQVYEQLLPYAVLFDFEQEWQSELAKYYRESSPEWVASTGGTNLSFSRILPVASFNSSVTSARTTHVSSGGSGGSSFSSSSGGSSGGGFSGGGGGGGGGRGI